MESPHKPQKPTCVCVCVCVCEWVSVCVWVCVSVCRVCDLVPMVSSWMVDEPLCRVCVPSAGALSWLGSAAPPNVSEIWAWASEPEISTLSRAQSLRSAPSCCGCHQRIRTPTARAAGGSRTFTNLQEKTFTVTVWMQLKTPTRGPLIHYIKNVFNSTVLTRKTLEKCPSLLLLMLITVHYTLFWKTV